MWQFIFAQQAFPGFHSVPIIVLSQNLKKKNKIAIESINH